ncbi:MAG: hypothetical protein EB153_08740 [Nitrosopumilaceae archaeon]|nr:hypothetical protein [Nitrosopumilaceae archaeon]
MEIFVLRHGDANSDSKKIIDDSKRVLTDAGIKEVDGVSRFFGEFDIKLDHIFSSPLKRAKQTSEIILKNQKKAKLTELMELKPEGIINYVCSQKQIACNLSLKTGGLAKIKTISVDPLKGQLEWLLTPKMIRKVSK